MKYVENHKINCGRTHFDALGVDFKVATNIHEVLAEYEPKYF